MNLTTVDLNTLIFIITAVTVVGIAGYSLYLIRKKNEFNISTILPIIDVTIENLFELDKAKNNFDSMVLLISKQVKLAIDNSELPQREKDYWTLEKINDIVTVILRTLTNAVYNVQYR